MANTILLKAPAGASQIITTGPLNSGNVYTVDSNGYVLVDPRDQLELMRAGFSLAPQQLNCRDNLSATSDPGVANDNTQDYGPGSIWVNTSNLRVWMCIANGTGAAAWALDGVQPGVGIEPSSMVTQFGSGSATFPEEGNINRQISSAGVTPGATGADNVLAVYALPSNSFDQALRGLTITAAGSFAANANNKRVKIIYNPATAAVGSTVGTGGTTICDTNTITTNGTGWQLQATVFKYGAAGSNTQIGIHNQAQIGAAVASMLAPSLIAATENNAINIAVTGNATTATADIVFNWLEVNAMN
jgi:hypothetical protein